MNLDTDAGMYTRVYQRLRKRLIGLGQIDIFADQCNRYIFGRMFERIDQAGPSRQIRGWRGNLEFAANDIIKILRV